MYLPDCAMMIMTLGSKQGRCALTYEENPLRLILEIFLLTLTLTSYSRPDFFAVPAALHSKPSFDSNILVNVIRKYNKNNTFYCIVQWGI